MLDLVLQGLQSVSQSLNNLATAFGVTLRIFIMNLHLLVVDSGDEWWWWVVVVGHGDLC